ncbi:hypothetical protein [Leptospira noguchii]|uniref:Uncharacterized protein n=1 Tax=Leptospira noguchii str. 2001034031 TaxID=1193053 RepID=M6YW51_9LEPT|nr:hypothetical protein [Leptospira noguchii]EMO90598.1 hypothetical protein LEP1GSC024_0176 [Leptospira noguchii str. 2001034031]
MERKELNTTLSYGSRWETQRLASTVARETQNVAACCRNVRL